MKSFSRECLSYIKNLLRYTYPWYNRADSLGLVGIGMLALGQKAQGMKEVTLPYVEHELASFP